jgi:hypothetical protein
MAHRLGEPRGECAVTATTRSRPCGAVRPSTFARIRRSIGAAVISSVAAAGRVLKAWAKVLKHDGFPVIPVSVIW